MFFVAIFLFTLGMTCVELAAETSNFFNVSVFFTQVVFIAICALGSILLFLFGFFYPIRIKE